MGESTSVEGRGTYTPAGYGMLATPVDGRSACE